MATIPPLTKPWATLYDYVIPDVSNTTQMHKSYAHTILNLLLGRYTINTNISAGYVARHADSLWTMVACSDGTQVKTDGTNLFSETFTSSEWVLSNTGAFAKSWFVLQNVACGLQFRWAPNSATTTSLNHFAPISTPFTGGTVNVAPASAVQFGHASNMQGDSTTTTTRRMNFVCAPDGSFYMTASRQGSGLAQWVFGLMKTSGGFSGTATQPYVMLATTSSAAQSTNFLGSTSPWYWYWTELSQAYSAGGPVSLLTAGGANISGSTGYSVDRTAKRWVVPVKWRPFAAPQFWDFGELEDLYAMAGALGISEGQLFTQGGVVNRMYSGSEFIHPWTAPAPHF